MPTERKIVYKLMQENLVIVESPAKAKKIEEYLGKDYRVMSSYGHIRDLKKRELSINEQTMEPDYEIPEEAAAGTFAKYSDGMGRRQTVSFSTRLPNLPYWMP